MKRPEILMTMLKRLLLIVLVVVIGLAAGIYGYLQHPKFGSLPEGAQLEAIRASRNHVDGEFRNLAATQLLTGETTLLARLANTWRTRALELVPPAPVPAVKTDLVNLDRNADTVVWLGHSSYFVQLAGKRILVDPVFSVSASPVPFTNDAFEGTSIYTAQDMPEIDFLLITHDHWDHLDHPTVTALEPKVRTVVTGLGMGAHLRRWGYPESKLREADWFGTVQGDGITVHVLPARHYSGRLFTRNKALWAGFALETPQRRLFFSGDTGYGPHFDEIGRRFGGFDLVALDSGQYDSRWAQIHMTPEQASRAAVDLRARALLPGHAGKFKIARHAWDDPFTRSVATSRDQAYRLVTPRIGEPVRVGDEQQRFDRWWEAL